MLPIKLHQQYNVQYNGQNLDSLLPSYALECTRHETRALTEVGFFPS